MCNSTQSTKDCSDVRWGESTGSPRPRQPRMNLHRRFAITCPCNHLTQLVLRQVSRHLEMKEGREQKPLSMKELKTARVQIDRRIKHAISSLEFESGVFKKNAHKCLQQLYHATSPPPLNFNVDVHRSYPRALKSGRLF